MSGTSGARSAASAGALLAILSLAAVARFTGLSFGLPLPFARPDENRVARAASSMLDGDFRPASFVYPQLMPELNAATRFITGARGDDDPDDARGKRSYPEAYWTSRLISASAGVLTVLLVFFLGRRLRSPFEGLVASFLLSVTPLHVRDSHFGVTDVLMTLATTAALAFLVRSDGETRLRRFALGGALIGLATAAKQPAAIALVALAVAAFFPAETPSDARRTLGTRARGAALPLLVGGTCAAVVFLALNPYVLIEPARFVEDFRLAFGSESDSGARFGRGWIEHATFTLWHGLGPPLALAALAGLAMTILRGRRRDWLVVSFALAYYASVGSGKSVTRYMLPLTPVASLLAARAVTSVFRWKAVAAGATLLLAAPSALQVIEIDRLFLAKDTRLQAYEWLTAELAPGERVLWIGRYASPPTDRTDARFMVRDADFVQELLDRTADVDTALRAAGFSRIVWTDYWFTSRFDLQASVASRLARKLVLEATFSPLAPGRTRESVSPLFDRYDMLHLPYARLDGFDRMGPFVHVWRCKQ